jgi:hypothetical protein
MNADRRGFLVQVFIRARLPQAAANESYESSVCPIFDFAFRSIFGLSAKCSDCRFFGTGAVILVNPGKG